MNKMIYQNEGRIRSNNYIKSRLLLTNSLLIAIFLSMQSIRYFLHIDTLLISFIIIIIALMRNNKISCNKKSLSFYIFVLFWFSITKIFFEFEKIVNTYMIFFIVYAGTALYLCSKEYNPKKVMHYLCNIYILMSPFVLGTALLRGSTMGEVYSLLIGFFSLIVCIINKDLRISIIPKWIHLLVIIIYIYKILLVSTRGVYLSITVFLILYLIIQTSRSNSKVILKLAFIIIAGMIIYENLYEVLSILKGILDMLKIEINALTKSVVLLESQRFDHNRNWFYEYAKRGIAENWLFGQGIGSFEIQTGRVYIHNFILQILFEGGIIYFIPFAIIIFKSLKWLFPVKKTQKEMQIFIIILMSTTIPKLFFSETYIKEPKFWLLLMTVLVTKKYFKKTSIRQFL